MSDGTEKVTLTVEFGPIEGFIAESRRTRDLWSASYLLSYLMANAICSARQAGAIVIRPSIDENPLYLAVAGFRESKDARLKNIESASRVGSLPDTFVAMVDWDRAGVVAGAAEDGWWNAWLKVASHVWAHLESRARWPENAQTKRQWDWQIGTRGRRDVWNIRWSVKGPTSDGSSHWRRWQFFPFSELNGATTTGEMSTLSGQRTALRGDGDRRGDVRAFWSGISKQVGPYEIRPGGAERLDAISCVKRFFPHVAEGAIGWKVEISYASTRSVAVAPWLQRVLAFKCDELALSVSDVAEALKQEKLARPNTRLNPALHKAAREYSMAEWAEPLLRYDGDIFFPDDRNAYDDIDASASGPIKAAVRRLLCHARNAGLGKPSDYVAVLAMDGDHLTSTISDSPDRQAVLSKALAHFAREVPRIVEDGLGQPVYAGGDDVLALLPKDTALTTAARLRGKWRDVMAEHLGTTDDTRLPTISAGILYAHVDAPLHAIVRRAHQLLDDEAKERTGRDAFAVEVWTTNRAALTFGRKWSSGRYEDSPDHQPGHSSTTDLIDAATKLARDGKISSQAIYRLRPVLHAIGGVLGQVTRDDLIDLLIAEVQTTRSERGGAEAIERDEVGLLLDLLRRADSGLDWDVARFIRFLSSEQIRELR